MKKLLTKLVLVASLVSAMVVAWPATSYASAIGYAYWGGFSANVGGQTLRIPGGQLTHMISGKGYHITWDGANFASVGNLCDPAMRFTYGNGSSKFDGDVHWGCSHVGQWKYTLNRDVPRGSACAELWAKNWGVRVARQCHYVYG